MNMESLYFDWAATALPDMEIIRKSGETALSCFGNPSSAHREGKKASTLLKECRQKIADCLNVRPEQIIFTSGGTESDNLILFSLLNRKRDGKQDPGSILIPEFEHAAVWEPARYLKEAGWNLRSVRTGSSGLIRSDTLLEKISSDTELISIMAINNETGARAPIPELAIKIAATREKSGNPVFFHTDAVQALGKEEIDLKKWGVDAASFSGHKIGAPRGTGFLYLKNPIELLNRGGGQEGGIRGGTENLPGIFGLALAVEKRYGELEKDLNHAIRIKEYLCRELTTKAGGEIIPDLETVLSESYSPWILMISFPPIPGEVLARVLGDNNIAVSTGSACSSRHKKTFRVSDGLGISRTRAFSAIRLSWGPDTELSECESLIKAFVSNIETLRRVTGKRR